MACGDSVAEPATQTLPQPSGGYFDDGNGDGITSSSFGLSTSGLCPKCLSFWIIVFLVLVVMFRRE